MNSLIRSFVFTILLFSVIEASAQFGLRAKYNMNSFSNWDDYLDQNINGDIEKIFSTNIELGVDYWFRLKKYRIEFMPEIGMGLKTSSNYSIKTSTTDFSYFASNFNTHIYLFDLEGDCDCPTFSKQGPSLKKGFFLSFSPGILFNKKEISLGALETSYDSNQINFRIGIGAGFDIGISDLFTITPIISYNLTPGIAFDELGKIFQPIPPDGPGNPSTSGLKQIQFQLRFGFRPDYVKSYGRGRR
jgi:hypothetical protein